MPSTKGFFAHGATMTFAGYEVGGLLDIPLPEEDREEVEITDQRSEFQREFVPGLKDNGTLDLTLRMIPGDPGQAAMRENSESDNELEEVVITLPEHVVYRGVPQLSWTCDAYVQTIGGTLFWENTAAERTITLRISGGVTEAEVS
jgi:hypothetical protein